MIYLVDTKTGQITNHMGAFAYIGKGQMRVLINNRQYVIGSNAFHCPIAARKRANTAVKIQKSVAKQTAAHEKSRAKHRLQVYSTPKQNLDC